MINRRGVSGISIFVILLCFISCTPKERLTSVTPARMFSSETLYSSPKEAPKCKFLLDSYCNQLHSPESQGNISVKRSKGPIEIRQGSTENGFSEAYFRYSEAKMRNRYQLPADFRRVLDRSNYFGKLKLFLSRLPRTKMSLQDRLTSENADFELGYIWSAALNEAVLLRMSQKFPGFHNLPEKSVPVEYNLESRRVRRQLISDISTGLWKGDKNWNDVQEGFEKLRLGFMRMIPRLDIDEDIKSDWVQRIKDVQLVLPGSLPAIADEECSTVRANAYYYTYLNLITVCAGDFNSEDTLLTLAHEMAHALGIDRTRYLFAIRSEFGQRLAGLRHNICQPEAFSCEKWAEYKNNFSNTLGSLDGYEPELPDFQRCLKQRPTARTLGTNELERFARSFVNDRISDLASSNRFVRITKEKIPMKDRKEQKNPNYLNPCNYYLWSQGEEPIDDELTTLLYFTAEYRCSSGKEATRIKEAIELSKEMTTKLMEKTLKIEGEFSARNVLEREGFSSPPFERFADVVGSYAMSELLNELPEVWDRRNVFLASNSWQCVAPSIASDFPEETSVENEYIFSSHALGEQRRKEIFSEPLRQALSCEKDFEFNECKLPFKKRM